jgi:anti-sigma factor RsiW
VSCAGNEASLALYAGGDLPEAAAGPLRAHLEHCPDCRQVLAEFSETTDWLRGQHTSGSRSGWKSGSKSAWKSVSNSARMSGQISAVDQPLLAELQRRVAREVVGRRQAPWLLAWWGRLFEAHRQPLGVDRGVLAGQPVLAGVGAALLVLGLVGALSGGRPVTELAAQQERAAVQARGVPAAAVDPGLRIEMQTGDPDVRIIWFAAAQTGRR